MFYDRELLDDELYQLWARFQPNVRIAVMSDSCHSGTVTARCANAARFRATRRLRAMPEEVEQATYAAHKDLYDGINRRSRAT